FRDRQARETLFEKITGLSNDRILLPGFSRGLLPAPANGATRETRQAPVSRQANIARAMRSYRNTGVGYATVRVPDKDSLVVLVASGAAFRIDPVRRLTSTSPGEGPHPAPPLQLGNAPIVAVIDGGLHASTYQPAEAWRAPPLIPDHEADRQHGNGVSSLAVHAHAWNNNRNLPALECRIGTVQAVPHKNNIYPFDDQELVDYLDTVARARREGRVWNISANQSGPGLDHEVVSVLGEGLRRIAREHNILPIISIGNVGSYNSHRPDPPADCEAAIVVGGRESDNDGNPAQACPVCLSGPGPDGMLRPDVSWFSRLRMLGGAVDTGSSYATPLISSLAAHTFDALRNPTPDLVKALLINAADLDEHDPALGWGTPYNGHMPWDCAPGSVTLAWRARLEPGTAYYWNDIPIPPELVRNGRLFGKARLTAVLNPLVSPFAGANYFSSRLETALQYVDKAGADWKSLLGSMKESTICESEAREELKKWNPVRRHSASFITRGRQFVGSHFRLYARVYTRDLYQFGWRHHSQAGPQEVAFVLTLWSGEQRRSIYDSTVQALGTFVESAVLEQEIEQELEQ
ncbi:MAG: S8 family peptidase, partial [Rhodospirillaceae bacterium]|nr:S8 family peptidase [Rhodospirillaceae bacterium]